jgi:type IV pilus assembly protein PilA
MGIGRFSSKGTGPIDSPTNQRGEAVRNAIAKLRTRRDGDERGFTLIELMVVVLIIAILIAIAIPTFLGARRRAQDKQAQSNLRNALTAEKTYYVDTQAYSNVAADLAAIESSLDFTKDDGWVRGVQVESLETGNNGVLLRSESKSGTFFCIMDLARDVSAAYEGQTKAGTYYAKVSPPTAVCTGASFSADVATGW